MASRFSVEAIFKAVDKITAPVTKIQNRVGRFTRRAGAGFERLNDRVKKFTGGIKKAGVVASAAMLVTGGAMADVITTGAQFEQTLVSAAAKFPGEIRKGTEAFKQLETAARETGATTEFSASQSAEALNFLAMAGFDAQASVAALPGVVDLATAAGLDLAAATDIASDSLGAFGLAVKDPVQLGKNLARVNDVLAKTATSANTTIEDLFESIKEGGPVAVTAGASMETYAALAGTLANAGIKASKSGTTLKNMFLTLSAPSKEAASILKRLGVQTVDANGDMLDIVDVLGNLNKSLDGLGTAERSRVLEGIFGKIPIAGVNVLLDAGADKLSEYRKQLEAAEGASGKMAATMRDTVQGRLNSLQSAIEGVKISIFSMNEGPLADVIDTMTEWVRANEGLIASEIGGFLQNLIENFEMIVVWGKRIAILLGVIFAISFALKGLVLVLTAVNLVMAANPLVLITLGIMALIAAIAAAIIWWDEIKEAFLGLPGPVQAAIAVLTGPIGWLIDAAVLIMDHWAPIKDFFATLWGGIVDIFNAAIENITGAIDTVLGAFKAISESAVGSAISKFFGFGDDDPEKKGGGAPGSEVVSPQDRIATSIEEKRQTSMSEVTIKDETGRAEVTKGRLGGGLALASSGGL